MASCVRDLIDDKISWVLGFQDVQNSLLPITLVSEKKEEYSGLKSLALSFFLF